MYNERARVAIIKNRTHGTTKKSKNKIRNSIFFLKIKRRKYLRVLCTIVTS